MIGKSVRPYYERSKKVVYKFMSVKSDICYFHNTFKMLCIKHSYSITKTLQAEPQIGLSFVISVLCFRQIKLCGPLKMHTSECFCKRVNSGVIKALQICCGCFVCYFRWLSFAISKARNARTASVGILSVCIRKQELDWGK